MEPSIGDDFANIPDDIHVFESFSGTSHEAPTEALQELIYESFREKYSQQQKQKVSLRYVPTALEQRIESSYVPLVEVFLYKRDILAHINKLWVFLYQNIGSTRGRMKWWNIHLYGVEKINDSEFLWVLLHEFAHYYDIYSLPGSAFWDKSQKFYDISWDSVTIMKTWNRSEDFVSGYAMTNQYEDFAESYLYYVLHNDDFLKKAENNLQLAAKYRYFQNYIFTANQYAQKDFSSEEIKDYYWDITKIEVDVKKFLQYLQEGI